MCAAVNPCVNLKLLVMVGQKFVMVGQETVLVGQMPTHILNKPWNNNLDSVTVMLNDLKWPTLQSHHKYLRLILLFKVVNHLQLIPEHYLPSPTKLTSTRSNHPSKFYHVQTSCDTYKFSFFPRTIPENQ